MDLSPQTKGRQCSGRQPCKDPCGSGAGNLKLHAPSEEQERRVGRVYTRHPAHTPGFTFAPTPGRSWGLGLRAVGMVVAVLTQTFKDFCRIPMGKPLLGSVVSHRRKLGWGLVIFSRDFSRSFSHLTRRWQF